MAQRLATRFMRSCIRATRRDEPELDSGDMDSGDILSIHDLCHARRGGNCVDNGRVRQHICCATPTASQSNDGQDARAEQERQQDVAPAQIQPEEDPEQAQEEEIQSCYEEDAEDPGRADNNRADTATRSSRKLTTWSTSTCSSSARCRETSRRPRASHRRSSSPRRKHRRRSRCRIQERRLHPRRLEEPRGHRDKKLKHMCSKVEDSFGGILPDYSSQRSSQPR